MAVSTDSKMVGHFTEKDFGNQYSFMLNPDPKTSGAFPHLIVVCDLSTRMAVIKKTVAYIVLDEYEGGNYFIEKWQIKNKRTY